MKVAFINNELIFLKAGVINFFFLNTLFIYYLISNSKNK